MTETSKSGFVYPPNTANLNLIPSFAESFTSHAKGLHFSSFNAYTSYIMINQIKTFVQHKKSLLILHFTVFIWGFTGILGALISTPAAQLVWYRVLIAYGTLLLWFLAKNKPIKVQWNALVKLFLTGAILGLHWILFFYSIKVSTVSVTLVSLSSITLFISILEPLTSRKSISKLEIITGLTIIAGIALIFKFETKYSIGIITGLASALCASIFSIINSKLVKNISSTVISFYELLGAWLWLSLYLLIQNHSDIANIPNSKDIVYLLILGILCTAVAYVLGVSVMKELSAFRVALITNLEPLYGIALAYFFFGKSEQMSIGFYMGSALIIGAIFLFPYLKNKIKK